MNDFQVTDFTGRSGEIMTWIKEKEWLENVANNSESRIFNIVELTGNKLIGTKD